MYKKDLILNNVQRLICYRIKSNQTESDYNIATVIQTHSLRVCSTALSPI